jgi:hypothetical protein
VNDPTVFVTDPTVAMFEAPADGGAYVIVKYLDAGERPVPKSRAAIAVYIEYDARHTETSRTRGGIVGREQWPAAPVRREPPPSAGPRERGMGVSALPDPVGREARLIRS